MKKQLLLLCVCLCIIGLFLVPKKINWKIYHDPKDTFEVKYPDTIVPDIGRSGDFSTITFGHDVVVTTAPKIDTLPIDPGDVFTDVIRIDSYSASVFKTRYEDGTLSEGYKVVFQTETHLYRLFILNPDHARYYIQSFKVLDERATIAR